MGYCKQINCLILASMALMGGCATSEFPGEANLGDRNPAIKQSREDREAQMSRLKELVDDQQKQLRQLNDELNECRSKK